MVKKPTVPKRSDLFVRQRRRAGVHPQQNSKVMHFLYVRMAADEHVPARVAASACVPERVRSRPDDAPAMGSRAAWRQ